MVIAVRYNPNGSVKEVKRYPSTKKGKVALAVDAKQHTEEFRAGKINHYNPNWPA